VNHHRYIYHVLLHVIKQTILILLFIYPLVSLSQPVVVHTYGDSIIYRGHHFLIGKKHTGIGFGNFIYQNGIKLAFLDKDTLTNGISISLSQRHQLKTTNGVEIGANITTSYVNGAAIGFVNSIYEKLNGISFSVLYEYNWKTNGVAVSGLFEMSDYMKGISIGGLADIHHKMNGFTLTGAYESVDSLKGVSIAGVAINADNTNGVTISLINITNTGHGLQIGIFNEAKSYKGVQIGLININKSKKHLKLLPFVNIK